MFIYVLLKVLYTVIIVGYLTMMERTKEGTTIINRYFSFNWMFSSLPYFPIRGDQVDVLQKPEEFYDTLMTYCLLAKKRIILSSLYLGSGEQERSLVCRLQESMSQCGPSLNVRILLDGFRGCRGQISSKHMLSPLVNRYPNCQVSFYYTPNFPVSLRNVIPERCNEIIGLQHMKVYIFDDDLLISGANLNRDYFTNRQDRYVVIKNCRPLADFFDGVVDKVCSMSSQLNADGEIVPSYSVKNKSAYLSEFKNKITGYYEEYLGGKSSTRNNSPDCDTWIFPLVELPPIGVHYDSDATKILFREAPNNSTVHLATGYFNLTKDYGNIIINGSKATYKLLLAHPSTNGFHSASGFPGYIPAIYSVLAEKFLNSVIRGSASNRIAMYEYKRNGWTYHGKGLWYTAPGATLPEMTVIGSTNFGDRSTKRDLENQITILTNNAKLKQKLYEERENLFKHSELLQPTTLQSSDRKSSFWLQCFTYLFKSFF